MNEIINVKEIFKTSFEIYKNNFQTFISISLIFAVIIVLLAQVSPVRGSGLSFIFTTISMLISSWFSMALMYASAALLQKKNITWQEALMLPKERFRMYVIVNAALFLLIISGFLLFIVPGVYLAVVYNFTSTITVLEKTEFKESFMRSAALVKGRFIQIMGFLA
ncbi:MAG: cytochrome b subunit of formate dehydrogenase, partial [Candidatus Omnitrophota bacterium]